MLYKCREIANTFIIRAHEHKSSAWDIFAMQDLPQLLANWLYSGYGPISKMGFHFAVKLMSWSNYVIVCG